MTHLNHLILRLGVYGFYAVAFLVVATLLIAAVYAAMRMMRNKMEYRELLATFHVSVPSDSGSIELRYCHIELLSELVQPRSDHYLRRQEAEWESRLNRDIASVMAMFSSAGLIRKSGSVEGGNVVSKKGAALVAEYGRDAHARKAANYRVRKHRYLRGRVNETDVA